MPRPSIPFVLIAASLMAAIAQGSDDAKARLKDFLEKRGKKVLRG